MKVINKIIITFIFFILWPFLSICQQYHHFSLKVHFDDSSVKTLGIGEAYWWSFKPLHAAKIKFDSSINHNNTFLFEGTTLYPTAIRIYPTSRTNHFNKLIFIDTGYQEINLIKKDSFYVIKANTAIEKEHRKFLNEMKVKTIDDKIDGEKLLTYVKLNPDSYVALFAIINQAFNYPYPSIFDKINNTFGKRIRQTQAFQYYLNKYSPKTIGPIDTNLLGTSIDGKKITLSAFKGKSFVLLDFWATWCMPCRQMTPHLKDLYKKLHSKGLEIISIASSLNDDKGAWKKAVVKDGMKIWINLFSEEPYTNGPDLGIKYGVTELPTTILIDKQGNVIGRYVGNSEVNSDMDKKLMKIFEQGKK